MLLFPPSHVDELPPAQSFRELRHGGLDMLPQLNPKVLVILNHPSCVSAWSFVMPYASLLVMILLVFSHEFQEASYYVSDDENIRFLFKVQIQHRRQARHCHESLPPGSSGSVSSFSPFGEAVGKNNFLLLPEPSHCC